MLTEGRSPQSLLQRLGHGEVAAIGERSLNQFILNAEVLKAVVKVSISHVDGELLEHIGLLGVKVESHLREPLKAAEAGHLVRDEHSSRVTLVD